jgi:hypothetical protein
VKACVLRSHNIARWLKQAMSYNNTVQWLNRWLPLTHRGGNVFTYCQVVEVWPCLFTNMLVSEVWLSLYTLSGVLCLQYCQVVTAACLRLYILSCGHVFYNIGKG